MNHIGISFQTFLNRVLYILTKTRLSLIVRYSMGLKWRFFGRDGATRSNIVAQSRTRSTKTSKIHRGFFLFVVAIISMTNSQRNQFSTFFFFFRRYHLPFFFSDHGCQQQRCLWHRESCDEPRHNPVPGITWRSYRQGALPCCRAVSWSVCCHGFHSCSTACWSSRSDNHT